MTAVAAVDDFGLVTSHGRKRNCLFRLDFSIVSGSVTVMVPVEEQEGKGREREGKG